jgi:hypothetical protein
MEQALNLSTSTTLLLFFDHRIFISHDHSPSEAASTRAPSVVSTFGLLVLLRVLCIAEEIPPQKIAGYGEAIKGAQRIPDRYGLESPSYATTYEQLDRVCTVLCMIISRGGYPVQPTIYLCFCFNSATCQHVRHSLRQRGGTRCRVSSGRGALAPHHLFGLRHDVEQGIAVHSRSDRTCGLFVRRRNRHNCTVPFHHRGRRLPCFFLLRSLLRAD